MLHWVENSANLNMTQIQIVVTGSRGKSSVARLLFCALSSYGLQTWARITGVVPRELSPFGERAILRSAGGHVEEMRWWLRSLPPHAEAVVLENSAVAPELQKLPSCWLKNPIFVITNVRSDHQDAWGPGEEGAVLALTQGIPRKSTVFIPESTSSSPLLLSVLTQKQCQIHIAAFSSLETCVMWKEENMAIVRDILSFLGLDPKLGEEAMTCLLPDIADFQEIKFGENILAVAFSANDVETTQRLFESLRWPVEDTTLLFNNRRDRPERLKAFLPWLRRKDWKKVYLMGARPFCGHEGIEYIKMVSTQEFASFMRQKKRVLGCGNVAGLPLEYLLEYTYKRCKHA
ncbi:MAG: Mur ligase family protein [Aminobacterium sp.]|nr:Mur ligase family protein [Aminobacterium sp.]MDD4551540.1 Mur ligase family protein [Aminobacterium sp.]